MRKGRKTVICTLHTFIRADAHTDVHTEEQPFSQAARQSATWVGSVDRAWGKLLDRTHEFKTFANTKSRQFQARPYPGHDRATLAYTHTHASTRTHTKELGVRVV